MTFVVGAAIMAGAVHLGMVIVGRLILGLGVGVGTTVHFLLSLATPLKTETVSYIGDVGHFFGLRR